jgi:spoIIIJ-associated protein
MAPALPAPGAGMSEVSVEATGETVAEAKYQALRELEQLQPSLDKTAVRFQVVTEGKRGLLGVGYTPARVVASIEAGAVVERPAHDESPQAAHVRDVVEHVTAGLGLPCRIDVDESAESIVATCSGGDLGLLIGRHGATIDAVQTLVGAIVARDEEERKEIVVDAAGYRDRRRRTLEALAVRSADEAVRDGRRVALEPMSAAERKLVHERLKDYEGVQTLSEGDEPHRYVVVELA